MSFPSSPCWSAKTWAMRWEPLSIRDTPKIRPWRRRWIVDAFNDCCDETSKWENWTSHNLWCQSGTLLLRYSFTLTMLEYIKLTLRSRKVGNTSKPNLKVCAVVNFKANKIIQSFDNHCMSGIVIIRNVCVLAWFEASLPVLWLWPFLSQYNLQSTNILYIVYIYIFSFTSYHDDYHTYL